MPGPNAFIELLVLWAAVAAAYGLVALAIQTRKVEREYGLRRSKHHLRAALAVLAVVGLVAILGTLATLKRPPAAPAGKGALAKAVEKARPAAPAPNVEELAELQRKRRELEEQLAKLRERIESIRAADPGDLPAEVDSAIGLDAEGPTVPIGYLLAAPALVAIGVVLLLVLGNREVLVGFLLGRGRARDRGELRLKALANLDRLIAAADKGEHLLGLEVAAEVDAHLLDRFDAMNLLFLQACCAVNHAMSGVAGPERERRLQEAIRALTSLLEEAPNHAEALYVLATAQGFLGHEAEAVTNFSLAQEALGKSDLPFAENQSVCLLRMAEDRLGRGDAEESARLFDRVTRLKVMADRIPTSLVKVRLLGVRKGLQSGQVGEAVEGIRIVRELEGLDPELRKNVDVVCDAYQALVSVRQKDDAEVVRQIDQFLSRHFPGGLPEVDEEIADEYLEAPIAGIDLSVDARVFGAFLFLKAAVLARSAARPGAVPTPAQVAEIVRTLLTALQFELRQRDLLAALGGVYYWFLPEKRDKAMGWLESSVAMGVESRVARRILERDKRIELENREALEWFRSATGRYLHDPTVNTYVRQALIEELGRFRGFQPMLLELDRQADLEPEEPTVRLLRERAEYMRQVVSDFAARKSANLPPEFDALRREYSGLIAALESSTGRMSEIERRFVHEVGRSVLS